MAAFGGCRVFMSNHPLMQGKSASPIADMKIISVKQEVNSASFKVYNIIGKYLKNHSLSAYVYFKTKNTLHLPS